MSLIKRIVIFSLFGLFLNHTSFASAIITKTLLTLDMENAASLPRNFRTTDHTVPSDQPVNWLGLTDLQLVGTSQFSENALLAIMNELHTNNIIDVDLRQESHGFLNGHAISWYAPQDAANAGLSNMQINDKEKSLLNKLSHKASIKLFEILSKNNNGYIDNTQKLTMPVYQVMTESDLVKKYKLRYMRFYIQDFHAPSDAEVDRFISFIQQLLPNHGYLLFHCHAGVGRTTLFMVMVDMINNAKTVSFDDILTREALIGGRDLREISDPHNFKHKTDICRLDFLKRFYEYTKTNTDQFTTSWSNWNKNKRANISCQS